MEVTQVTVDMQALKQKWGWFLGLGIVIALIGVAALAFPWVATWATVLMFGYFLIISGISQAIFALSVRDWQGVAINLVSGWFLPELTRTGSGAADGPQELPLFVEHRNPRDQIGGGDIGVALCHVDIAIPVGHHVGRVSQGAGRVASHTWLAQGHQHLAFRTEFDHHASLVLFSGKLVEVVWRRGACIRHPDVAIAVHDRDVRGVLR